MSNVCELCGKHRFVGGTVIRKGMAKKKGGIGMHVVKNNKRLFKPNIQHIRLNVGGKVRKMNVCSACIRTGKITKA